jgi:hypothetical protein
MNYSDVLMKDVNEILGKNDDVSINKRIINEILFNEKWTEIEKNSVEGKEELTLLIILKISNEFGKKNKRMMDKDVKTIMLAVEHTIESYKYLEKVIEVIYTGKNIFKIYREELYFEINNPPEYLVDLGNSQALEWYGESNNIFLNYLEKEIFHKEINAYYSQDLIFRIFNRMLIEKYKISNHFKMKEKMNEMYK